MNQFQQYGAPPYGNLQNPTLGWYAAPYIDPEKQERKKLRRAASRLSFAILVSIPISVIFSTLGMTVLSLCGVNFLMPQAGSIGGFPATAYYLLSSVLSIVTTVVPFSLFLLAGHRRLSDTVLVERTGKLHGLLIVFAALFICIIMNIPAGWISAFLESLGLNGASNTEAFSVNSVSDLLTMLLSVVLVAPVAEEFAFRGVTVAVMRRWGDWTAVIFSMLIFGMAHYSFQALPVVLAGGFVMALLYVRTRNIWLNIFVHFLNNLVATLPIAVKFLFGAEAAGVCDGILFVLVVLLGIGSIAALLIGHYRGKPVFSRPMQRGIPLHGKVGCIVFNPGFILYILVFIGMSVSSLYG